VGLILASKRPHSRVSPLPTTMVHYCSFVMFAKCVVVIGGSLFFIAQFVCPLPPPPFPKHNPYLLAGETSLCKYCCPHPSSWILHGGRGGGGTWWLCTTLKALTMYVLFSCPKQRGALQHGARLVDHALGPDSYVCGR